VTDDLRSKAITFTLVGHAHIDPVWLWDWREGYETVRATFRSALDRLRENPDMVFAHSSASQYVWMTHHPALLEEIRDAVTRGQWEPVGGWWTEPDVNLAGGEALLRQGLYGQRALERLTGKRARVAFLPDSFGHPATLPQLFKLTGLEYFVFMRPQAHELTLPSNLFWWQSLDGSRVLSARVECYNTNPVHIKSSLERGLNWRPADAPEWIHLFGVGNHGGGPTKAAIQNVRDLAASPDWPTLQMGSLEGFFERAQTRVHPTWSGELQHHARGCYSAHSEVKRLNRRAEHALIAAESWSVVAAGFALPYPRREFGRAWEHVLFNQFHDILAGSSLESAYEDTRHQFGAALEVASTAQFTALQVIASQVDTRRGSREADEVIRRPEWTPQMWTTDLGDGVPVIVFNPSPWRRTETVHVELNEWMSDTLAVLDDADRPVPHQRAQPESASGGRPRVVFSADLPPLGYRVYRAVLETQDVLEPNAVVATDSSLENRWWRLEVDAATGTLKRLYDKTRDREWLNGAGAQLLVMRDPTDTWGHGMTALRDLEGAFECLGCALLESGPVRAVLEVRLRYGASTARQRFELHARDPRITATLEVDWFEQHRALKLAFPFALEATTATFEVPYGATARPASGDEEPVQRWLDVTGTTSSGLRAGVTLLNDGKYAADVLDSEARVTILRSPVYAHHDPAKLEPNVTYRYQDQGLQITRWALLAHDGDVDALKATRAAQDFNAPLSVVREYVHVGSLPKTHSFAHLEPEDAVNIAALKIAEDGEDIIVRLHNPRHIPARATLHVLEHTLEVALEGFQIKTYRLNNGGASVVNALEEPL
jgi:alpha-mannosidase